MVQLVHTLIACVKPVQQGNLVAVGCLVNHRFVFATLQDHAMRKVTIYSTEALTQWFCLPTCERPCQRLCSRDALLRDLALPQVGPLHGEPGDT